MQRKYKDYIIISEAPTNFHHYYTAMFFLNSHQLLLGNEGWAK